MKICSIILINLFLISYSYSQREVKLEKRLEKTEQRLEDLEESLANALKEIADLRKDNEFQEAAKQQSKIKIDGTVFVKTQGGENIKLALIPIGVSTLEEYEAACVSVLNNIASIRTKNTPLFEKKIIEYKTKYKEAENSYKKFEEIGKFVQEANLIFDNRMRAVIELLQTNGAQTRSNADGKFSVELDPEKDYVLTGFGERKTGNSTEKYNWIVQINVPVGEKNREVFFSNSELAESILNDQEEIELWKVRIEKLMGIIPD